MKNYIDYQRENDRNELERTKENLKNTTDPQRIIIMEYHIKRLETRLRSEYKRVTGDNSIGGEVCDIVDKLY